MLILYFASGICLTIYNKYVLSPERYGFHFPVTMILSHMSVNCVLSGLALRLFCHSTLSSSPLYPSNITRGLFLSKFVPIGLLFGLDITLTNVSFRYVSVSLTEVVKSSVPAWIFVYNVCRSHDRTSSVGLKLLKLLNVVLICAGVACTAVGEANHFEIRGFLAAIGATIAATMKLISVETLLTDDHSMTHTSTVAAHSSINSTVSVSPIASSSSASPKMIRVAPADMTTPSHGISSRKKEHQTDKYAPVAHEDDTDTDIEIEHLPTKHLSIHSSSASINPSSPVHIFVGSSPSPPPVVPAHAPHGRLHPVLSLFYFTPVSAIALIPIQLSLERADLAASRFMDAGTWEPTVALILAGSLVAFGLNASELFVIQETSALTLCIFGVLKFLIVIAVSVALFDYEFTTLKAVGIALAVLGLIVYNCVKWQEMNAALALSATHSAIASNTANMTNASHHDIDLTLDDEQHHRHHHTPSHRTPIHHRHHSGSGNHQEDLTDDNTSASSSSSNSSVGSIDTLLPSNRSPAHSKSRSTHPSHGSHSPHQNGHLRQPSGANDSGSIDDLGSRLRNAFNALEQDDLTTDDDQNLLDDTDLEADRH